MKFKKTASAAMLASILGATAWGGTAQANAYAFSETLISNGFVISSDATKVSIVGRPNNTSTDSATLNGTGPANSQVGLGLQDAAQAAVGAVTAGQNSFAAQGAGAASFSRADSQLIQEQASNVATPGTGIVASTIAESFVNGNNTATASGLVASGTLFSEFVSVTTPGGFLTFAFDAITNLIASLTADAVLPGSSAKAVNTFSITLQGTGANAGSSFFLWNPNGSVGGTAGVISNTVGATETADGVSLNTNRESQVAGFTASLSSGLQHFSAQTGLLEIGDYQLTLSSSNSTSVVNVPEPTSLALLGLGLMGMGFASVKRKQA